MDLPTSIYMLRRNRGEDKVVTTKGVSCITTQINSKGVFLCFNVKIHIRDYEEENLRMIRKFPQEQTANIAIRDL